jgi:OmpA-OmpF porin, OOP family
MTARPSPSSAHPRTHHGRSAGLWAGLALLLLGACAPLTRVTLLPQPDGSPSAVEVRNERGAQLIGTPYQVVTVDRRGTLGLELTTAEQVRQAYPWLQSLELPAPERFVLEFEPGSSQLTAPSQAQLATVVERALVPPGGEILGPGHTDRRGSLEANDRLSLERARAVRGLLIERGFSAERIEAVGRGEREPLVPTEDEVEEPRNRRADILVR